MAFVSTRPQCLLLVPEQGLFSAVRKTIITALQEAGLDPIANGKTGPEMETIDQLRAGIDSADLIIADITGSNPNVLLELGMSLGRGKTVLTILNREVPLLPTEYQ